MVVQYEGRNNSVTNYVGKMLSSAETDDGTMYDVEYLKKRPKTSMSFYKPSLTDDDTISGNMIVQKIEAPKMGTGSRKYFVFSDDLSDFRFYLVH